MESPTVWSTAYPPPTRFGSLLVSWLKKGRLNHISLADKMARFCCLEIFPVYQVKLVSQLKRCGDVVGMPPGQVPGERFRIMSNWEKPEEDPGNRVGAVSWLTWGHLGIPS